MGASRALEELARLMPSDAHKIMPDGSTQAVPLDDLGTGDRVLVKPGEKVPDDIGEEELLGVKRIMGLRVSQDEIRLVQVTTLNQPDLAGPGLPRVSQALFSPLALRVPSSHTRHIRPRTRAPHDS